MAYDGLLLRAMVIELRKELIGMKLDKINQPQRGAFVLTFKNRHLLISVEPSAAYVALTDKKMTNPAEPPMFCMLLRKYLTGAALKEIRQEGCDRTIYFVFSALNSSYEPTKRTLVAEIMGRHANLLLLDEEERIIDCIKRAALDSRQALPGLVYEPFLDDRKNILETPSYDEDTNFLKEFQGFSKMSARYAAEHYLDLNSLLSIQKPSAAVSDTKKGEITDRLREVAENEVRGGMTDTAADDSYPSGYTANNEHVITESSDSSLVSPLGYTCADADGNILDFYFLRDVLAEGYPDASITEYGSLSEATNAFYMRSLKAVRLKKISQDIKKISTAGLDRITGKISKMKSELEEAENSGHLRMFGDLLLTHAYHIKEGADRVTLTDFDGNEVEIRLDIHLDAAQNAQKYYQKYKKSISAVKHLEIQIEKAQEDANFLSTSIVMLEFAENEQDVEDIRRELESAGFLKKIREERQRRHGQTKQSKAKTKRRIPVHKFTLSSGRTLLVGKSNTANDELTMKYASNSDTWLHTNTIPGSHCIIRCEGKEPTDSELEEAAEIAAYYSKARMSTKVPVDYCKVKYVKKPPGAKAGMVTYTNFKTVLVEPKIRQLKKEEVLL